MDLSIKVWCLDCGTEFLGRPVAKWADGFVFRCTQCRKDIQSVSRDPSVNVTISNWYGNLPWQETQVISQERKAARKAKALEMAANNPVYRDIVRRSLETAEERAQADRDIREAQARAREAERRRLAEFERRRAESRRQHLDAIEALRRQQQRLPPWVVAEREAERLATEGVTPWRGGDVFLCAFCDKGITWRRDGTLESQCPYCKKNIRRLPSMAGTKKLDELDEMIARVNGEGGFTMVKKPKPIRIIAVRKMSPEIKNHIDRLLTGKQRKYRDAVVKAKDSRLQKSIAATKARIAKLKLCKCCKDVASFTTLNGTSYCQDCWEEISGRSNGMKQLSGKSGGHGVRLGADYNSDGPVGVMGHNGIGGAIMENIVRALEEDR